MHIRNNLPDILWARTITDHSFCFGRSIWGATAHKRAQIKLSSPQPRSIFYISVTAPCWRLACNVASVFFMMYIPGECWADWSHSGLQIGKQMCVEKKKKQTKKTAGKRWKKKIQRPWERALERDLFRIDREGWNSTKTSPKYSKKEGSSCWMSPNPGGKNEGD